MGRTAGRATLSSDGPPVLAPGALPPFSRRAPRRPCSPPPSIGRQFAVVELVAALCSLVRRYDVSLAEPARPGEGVEARRARVLDSDVGVVLALKRPVALVFRERKQRPI
jgi:hypothetical protein